MHSRAFLQICRAIAIAGLVASAVVHISAYFGVDWMRVFPPVVALHLVAILLMVALVFWGRKDDDSRSAVATGLAVALPMAAYACVLFFLVSQWNHGAVPDVQDGVPGLYNHGLIEPLTSGELRRRGAYESLAVSSVWMAFYLMQTVAFGSLLSLPADLQKRGVPRAE